LRLPIRYSRNFIGEIMREKFTNTGHCKSHAHCHRCRDRNGGRVWREKLQGSFTIDEVDFVCPEGRVWHYGGPMVGRWIKNTINWVARKTIKRNLKPCISCKDREEKLNEVFGAKEQA